MNNLFSIHSFQYAKIPLQFFRDQSGVVKFYGSFAFNRKRNVLELEIKQDYTSLGTQKYVVSFFPKWPFALPSPLLQSRKGLWVADLVRSFIMRFCLQRTKLSQYQVLVKGRRVTGGFRGYKFPVLPSFGTNCLSPVTHLVY